LARFSSALICSHSELRDLSDKVFPLWSYIGANLADFCNPFYRTDVLDGPCPPLQPNYKPSDLSFWSSYFLRHTFKPRIANLKRVIAGMSLDSKNLKLSGEGLPFFPSNLLIRATGIQILDLSNNELTQFPPEIENLVFLSKLRLQNNRIVYVHESLIRKLTSLQDLGLSSNGLKSIGGLEYLSRLEKLKLSSNRLEILPKFPSKVTALELDTNPATNANEIALGSCLRHADFSSLSLTKFPLQLLNSKDLVSLRMARNQLSDLPLIVSVLVKLQQLKMDHNPLLLKLPAALFSLKNLRFLSLDHCNISEVDKGIVSLSSLRSLSLANNCILTLPNEFFALKELHHLDLSGNVIEELPSLLGKLTQLEDLCLSHNAITGLPAEISNLLYLTSLDISYNQLKHITPEIGLLNPLQELKFDGNSLKTPPQYIIDGGHKAVMQHLRSLCGQEGR
jgi:Leucine-rich repeat (LRR) protein